MSNFKGALPFISPNGPRTIVRAALERCKSNSLTQRFIRPMCAHAEEKGRGASSPIFDDGMMFISFLRKASCAAFLSFRNIAATPRQIRASSRPSFAHIPAGHVIRRVLNKFSQLLPLPRRNTVSTGHAGEGYAGSGIDASLARHVSSLSPIIPRRRS